jgi:hypothetical protein
MIKVYKGADFILPENRHSEPLLGEEKKNLEGWENYTEENYNE